MKNLDLIIDLLAYEGAATNNPADAVKIRNKVQETAIIDLNRYQFSIADLAADQAISLPADEALYTVILVDREVSIKLNGSSDALTLTPRANGTKTWVFFTRGTVTGLTVSNSSGATANIDILAANK